MFNQGKYQEELKKAYESGEVEFDVPDAWYEYALKAMEFASPIGLGIRSEEMLLLYDLLERKERLNYLQFAICATNLENRSARDLDMKFKPYAELMLFCGELTEKWKQYTKEIEEEVLKKVQIESRAKT